MNDGDYHVADHLNDMSAADFVLERMIIAKGEALIFGTIDQ